MKHWKTITHKFSIAVILLLGTSSTFLTAEPPPAPLTMEERAEAHLQLEKVRDSHRVWDAQRFGPKPPFDEAEGRHIASRVADETLRRCDALERLWGITFSGEDLQAELDRMVRDSLMPDRLREYFAALNGDPRLAGECLARPILAENTLRERLSNDDRFQGPIRAQAEREWSAVRTAANLDRTSGMRSRSEWILAEALGGEPEPIEGPTTLDRGAWEKLHAVLREKLGLPDASEEGDSPLKSGIAGPLREDDHGFTGIFVEEASDRRVAISTICWEKADFGTWWERSKSGFSARVAEPRHAYVIPNPNAVNRLILAGGDSWVSITGDGAPSARSEHVSVWTGSEMIVWGGWNGSSYLKSGGKYNPATDSWTATNSSSAPDGRRAFGGVWQADEGNLYVWGGYGGAALDTGGIYTPGSDSWRATCDTPACNTPQQRYYHAMIPSGWSAGDVTIWGGTSPDVNTGGDYFDNGSTIFWTPTDTADPDCPTPRKFHSAVDVTGWGTYMVPAMVIWGGYDRVNTGGRYRLEDYPTEPDNYWKPVNLDGAPVGRHNHAAIAVHRSSPDNDRMLVWGGYTAGVDSWNSEGGIYDPVYNAWTLMTTAGAPDGRQHPAAVWTGHEMIVWGGDRTSSVYDTGGRYDFTSDAWQATDTSDPQTPSARTKHTAVWADTGMIVWGGYDLTNRLGDGAMYVSCWTTPNTAASAAASDDDPCDYTGIEVVWDQDVSVWGDNGYTSGRGYVVRRNGSAVSTGGCAGTQAYGTTSCIDTTASTDVAHSYSVDYVNACGDASSISAGSATDQGASAPVVTVECTVTDVDGCTFSSGMEITWPQDPGGGWGDNGVGDRKYRVWRWDVLNGWQALGSQIDYGTTSYVDAVTLTGWNYIYRVRYINGCGLNAETADNGPVQDGQGLPPAVSQTASAFDDDACTHSGILVTWPQDCDDWGDGGTGDRYYRVRRSIDGVNFNPIGTNIDYGTTSYLDGGASPDQLTYYQVRYKNGCGLDADSANASATDEAAAAPSSLTNSESTDADKCLDGGIDITWTADPGDWGDGGVGTRTYDVLREGSPIATGMTYGTTSYNDPTGVNGTAYLYQVRYVNGCGLTADTEGSNSNDRPFTPDPPASNSTASDIDGCDPTGVLVTWDADPDGNWGDNGVGPHTYEVLRDGISLQSGIEYGTTQYTDTSGTANTSYQYTVRYWNCGGLYVETAGAAAADASDADPCAGIGGTLLLTKDPTDAILDWADSACGDLDHYRVYATNDPSAPFPVQWTPLSAPAASTETDALGSAYTTYKVVTVDACGNESPN